MFDYDREYSLVKKGQRMKAAATDFIFVFLLAIGLSFLVFIKSEFAFRDLFVSQKDTTLENVLQKPVFEPWRVFVMALISFVVYFTYFIIIPTFNHSATLFRRVFKIHIISLVKQNDKRILCLSLIKQSLLVWFLFSLVSLLVVSFGFAFDINDKYQRFQYIQFIRGAIAINTPDDADTTAQVLAYLSKSLFSIIGLLSIIALISLFLKRFQRPLQDQMANVAVLDLRNVQIIKDKPQNQPHSKPVTDHYNEVLKELDQIK
ncbi:RDD family protein [Ureaplasma sp. ES3154-GEN]|uniref:RDD family protein n=1 Tax=Ureaplasma sp. ES3154-GEN TaxID=2984844 RepID=UPI0021E8B927|nr:RDD family protein [Ureaplasma sp. ES3154-GEN]MCV3743649.1 RDD family protein [Ureaplasma sp. ES3154-GEN]